MAAKKRKKAYPKLKAVLREIRKVEQQLRALRAAAEPAEREIIDLKLGYLAGVREQAKCPAVWNPHVGWPRRSAKKPRYAKKG